MGKSIKCHNALGNSTCFMAKFFFFFFTKRLCIFYIYILIIFVVHNWDKTYVSGSCTWLMRWTSPEWTLRHLTKNPLKIQWPYVYIEILARKCPGKMARMVTQVQIMLDPVISQSVKRSSIICANTTWFDMLLSKCSLSIHRVFGVVTISVCVFCDLCAGLL